MRAFFATMLALLAASVTTAAPDAPIPPAPEMLDTIGYFKASNSDVIEDRNAPGVNGDQTHDSSENSGAVYVFRRAGSGWRQEAYLKANVNRPGQSSRFGDA